MAAITLTESMQTYLKYILALQREEGPVSTQALAEALERTPASVTGMLKKLAEARLVEYEPYQGVRLTPSGLKVALEVLRHHRLLELYLAEALGYSWDQVHAEAERLEHHISEDFEDRIDAMLGYPVTDPHGEPIPSRDGILPVLDLLDLYDCPAGLTVVVARVGEHDPELLRYLAGLGIRLGTPLQVLRREPFDGPLYVRLANGEEIALGARPARAIMVKS